MIAEYITKEELQQYLTLQDNMLNLLYQQLRAADSRFYVREVKGTIRTPFNWKHPFRKRKETVIRYELLEDMNGQARVVEHPVREGHFLSTRTTVDAVELDIWIYGFLNGVRVTAKKLEEYHPKSKFSVGQMVKVVDADTMQKICKELGWTRNEEEERCCGCQFCVYDIRWAYKPTTYVYQLGQCGHCINWVREELIEKWEAEEIVEPGKE